MESGERDDADYAEWVRQETRRRLEWTAWACTSVFAVAWVVGRLRLSGTPMDGPGRFWLLVLTLVCLVFGIACRVSTTVQRHPMASAMVAHTMVVAACAAHISEMGGLDSPFFYAIYALPPLSIGLPSSMRGRVGLLVSGVIVFCAIYFLRRPEQLLHPMLHVPILVLTGICSVSLLLGRSAEQAGRARFLLTQRLARQSDTLRAQADALARAVDARERDLEELAGALDTVQFDRTEVARGLHDDLGQLVVGLRMELGRLESDGAELDYLRRVVTTLDRSVRGLLERLRQPVDELQFEPALREVAATVERGGVEVSVELQLDRALTPRERVVAHRFVQEACTNAIKHGRPRVIAIRAKSGLPDLLNIEVANDGMAFGDAPEGMGIRGMRERAQTIGAEISFHDEHDGARARLHRGAA